MGYTVQTVIAKVDVIALTWGHTSLTVVGKVDVLTDVWKDNLQGIFV